MSVKIDKNLSMPGNRRTSLPFDKLKVGESFLVPPGITAITARAAYWGAKLGRKFSTRSVDDGVRVWRTE